MAAIVTFLTLVFLILVFKAIVSDPAEFLFWGCVIAFIGSMIWVFSLLLV